ARHLGPPLRRLVLPQDLEADAGPEFLPAEVTGRDDAGAWGRRRHRLSLRSSYGAEPAMLVMSPRAGSAIRGPTPYRMAGSQSGANIALSCMSCWIRWRIVSRFFGSNSVACSRMRPSMSP